METVWLILKLLLGIWVCLCALVSGIANFGWRDQQLRLLFRKNKLWEKIILLEIQKTEKFSYLRRLMSRLCIWALSSDSNWKTFLILFIDLMLAPLSWMEIWISNRLEQFS